MKHVISELYRGNSYTTVRPDVSGKKWPKIPEKLPKKAQKLPNMLVLIGQSINIANSPN